jgi:hypothetical protein
MARVVKLHPVRGNLAQGATEIGAAAILSSVVLGATLADSGLSNVVVAIAVGCVLLAGIAVVVSRYLPMTVEVDPATDEVRYRNAWSAGVMRWSGVAGFEPSQVLIGYQVARAICDDGRRVKLRAAPYAEFARLLRSASQDG